MKAAVLHQYDETLTAREFVTYEEGAVKYNRRFYDYNYAQGTLVPYRSLLWANDKMVEETDVLTVTFGQRVDEDLFKAA